MREMTWDDKREECLREGHRWQPLTLGEGGWTLIECERCGERMERDDPADKGR